MLPEIGATELIVIAIVALVVVGPKDLPILLRKLGQFTAKLRGMAAEFRASFDEMARQSELDELRAQVEAMRKGQLADMAARDAGHAQVSNVMQEIDQGLRLEDATFPPNLASDDAMPAMTAEPPSVAKAAPKPRRKAAKPVSKPVAAKPKSAAVAAVKPPSAAKPARKPRAPKSGDLA